MKNMADFLLDSAKKYSHEREFIVKNKLIVYLEFSNFTSSLETNVPKALTSKPSFISFWKIHALIIHAYQNNIYRIKSQFS